MTTSKENDEKSVRRESILLVEDIAWNIELLYQMLKNEGYRVHVSTTGSVALDWLRTSRPDLILLDIILPDISGYEVCQQLKQDENLKSIPVIFLSGLSEPEDKIKGFELGGVDYITKPFFEAEVIRRVRTHLELFRYSEDLKTTAIALETRVRVRTVELETSNQNLIKSEAKYRRFVEAMEQEHFVYSRTREKTFDYLSASVMQITGYSSEEFSERYGSLLHTSKGEWCDYDNACKNSHLRFKVPLEIEIKSKDNTLQYLEVVETPVCDGGEIVSIEGVAHDITARKVAENELRLAANVFSTSSDGIMITDEKNRIVRSNSAFSQITGFSAEEILGRTPHFLQEDLQEDVAIGNLWLKLKERDDWQGEIWNRRKEGEVYPVWLNMAAVKNDLGQIIQYVSVFTDISEKKESQHKIHYMAHYDVLTKLPNRQLFQERGERTIQKSKRGHGRACIIFIDLDNFKLVNDSMGHPTGDMLLRVIADRLKSLVRDEDTVARLGGDEFIILLDDIENSQNAGRIAEKIGSAFIEPISINGREHHVSVSIGISIYPQDGEDIDTLVKNADAAMYEAKQAGRNTYRFYTQRLTQLAIHRLETESALYLALRNGEFELFYQPQISFPDNHIVGVEALIRWNHPDQGLIDPVEFIPIAEESHLIAEIGEWVIPEAISALNDWKQISDIIPKLAINISCVQLQTGYITTLIKKQLKKFDLKPELLQIEITEGTLMPHTSTGNNNAVVQLQAFREMGISIAIDDFGTGFSSLNHLKHLRVDSLKIDSSFIEELVDSSDDRAIVETIITLGTTLGLTVLAEGVETREQDKTLRNMGCHQAQGYLYCKPVSQSRITELLSNNINTLPIKE